MSFSSHRRRKRFGQHWLKDDVVLERILIAADISSEDRILEVGPGKGVLTEKLLASKAAFVHAIELDRDLVKGLKQRFCHQPRFSLQEGDVLKVPLIPLDGIPANKVVANIPYNITGPLLERLVGRLNCPAETIYQRLVILLQKEVAERILAKPGQSSFSALSVRLQLMANCRSVCLVPPRCFQPPPKVQSQVVVIEPLKLKDRLDVGLANRVELLLGTAFLARRKMLRNTLRGLSFFNELETLANDAGIDLKKRPQDLTSQDWLILARGLKGLDEMGQSA